ncbi:MAG: acyl-CoA dehydrogenase, partial [Actinomycetota bacterium]
MTMDNNEAEEALNQELRSTARSFFEAKMPLGRLADVADGERLGPERELWNEFVRMGWTGIMLPEDAGGAGAGLSALAVLFEEFGRSLCPTPHFASLALAAPCIDHEIPLAEALASGDSTFTMAWAEPPASRRLDGVAEIGCSASAAGSEWRLRGIKRAVPDAGSVSHSVVVARSDDGVGLYVVDLAGEGARIEAGHSVDGTRRHYSLILEDAAATPLASEERTRSVLREVRLRALVLLSYEAIGVAERILEDIVAYANERHQFGKPIGAFQAVSGPLVDAFVEVELARALARWAVRAIELGDSTADVAAVAAKSAASDAAVDTVERAIQVAGAIGFTWEYHLHRFLRRALWIASFDGTVAEGRQFVAAELLEKAEPLRTVELMDTAEVAAFRTSVRSWIADNLPYEPFASGGVPSLDTYEQVKPRWRKAMCESGNLVAHWPKEFGGRGASPAITAVFREEAIRAHPRVSYGDCGVDLVAPLLMAYGTPAQKDRFLEPIRTEAEVWTQAFSEPNAGSDLASLETRARKDGNHWVLNGNKTWCTYAPVADWIFVLART